MQKKHSYYELNQSKWHIQIESIQLIKHQLWCNEQYVQMDLKTNWMKFV